MVSRRLEIDVAPVPGGGSRMVLVGVITEEAPFADALEQGQTPVAIDAAGVQALNSVGVRDWIGFVSALSAKGEVVLERCSPALVRQLSMIRTARGGARVKSVMVPYYCEGCDEERVRELDLSGGVPSELPEVKCDGECGGEVMELDDDFESYFAFAKEPGALVG